MKLFSIVKSRKMFANTKLLVVWTDDDRIQVSPVNEKGEIVGPVELDVSIKDISFSGSSELLILRLPEKKVYIIDFSPLGGLLSGFNEGILGLALGVVSYNMIERSGVNEWRTALINAGVKSRYVSQKQSWVAALIIFGIMVGVFVTVQIVQALS